MTKPVSVPQLRLALLSRFPAPPGSRKAGRETPRAGFKAAHLFVLGSRFNRMVEIINSSVVNRATGKGQAGKASFPAVDWGWEGCCQWESF